MRNQVIHGCKIQEAIDTHEDSVTKEHGRIEQRKYEVYNAEPMLNKWRKEWPYIRNIIKITRYREIIGRKPTITTSYYVSNRELRAKETGMCIRNHWSIENKLHHIKDTAFMEDKCTKIVNPFIYSVCIDFAINILRSQGTAKIRETLYNNCMNFAYSIQNLASSFWI